MERCKGPQHAVLVRQSAEQALAQAPQLVQVAEMGGQYGSMERAGVCWSVHAMLRRSQETWREELSRRRLPLVVHCSAAALQTETREGRKGLDEAVMKRWLLWLVHRIGLEHSHENAIDQTVAGYAQVAAVESGAKLLLRMAASL